MPLRHFYKPFFINPDDIENSHFIIHNRKKIGEKLYGMAKRVFTEFISSRDENYSGGYFHFGMILGNAGLASKKDVDYLWHRMKEIYGDTDLANDMINKILGTICMICVANDYRTWVYKDDMERKEKLANNEIPDANEYFIAKYEIPEHMQIKLATTFEEKLTLLKNKFNPK